MILKCYHSRSRLPSFVIINTTHFGKLKYLKSYRKQYWSPNSYKIIKRICTHLSVNNSLLDPVVFIAGLQGYRVHASLTAEVSCTQPVLFDSLKSWVTPRKEVSTENENDIV